LLFLYILESLANTTDAKEKRVCLQAGRCKEKLACLNDIRPACVIDRRENKPANWARFNDRQACVIDGRENKPANWAILERSTSVRHSSAGKQTTHLCPSMDFVR
jgi:hypothetical protein